MRVICHLDLDCFYCQVEQRRLGVDGSTTPLAVQQWSGLIAVNYPARRAGVKRGHTAEQAKALCPQIRLVHVETLGADPSHSSPVKATTVTMPVPPPRSPKVLRPSPRARAPLYLPPRRRWRARRPIAATPPTARSSRRRSDRTAPRPARCSRLWVAAARLSSGRASTRHVFRHVFRHVRRRAFHGARVRTCA